MYFDTEPKVPCKFCGKDTIMLGTKLCDGCWELTRRIERDPELAQKILNEIKQSKDR